MTPEQEEYTRLQSEWLEAIGGLRKGDELLVMCKAQDFQGGWDNTWHMDKWVGRTCQYQGEGKKPSANGLFCHFYGETLWLPFYVLSKIERQ